MRASAARAAAPWPADRRICARLYRAVAAFGDRGYRCTTSPYTESAATWFRSAAYVSAMYTIASGASSYVG